MQQSSATPSLHLWFWGVAEDCCMLSLLLAVPSCIYSFWHGVIPTSYFIFNDFYTCSIIHVSPSVYTKLPSCIYSFWHGVIPTSYFIFNDFYTCIHNSWVCDNFPRVTRLISQPRGFQFSCILMEMLNQISSTVWESSYQRVGRLSM